jgi:hypothetical protein
MRSPKRQEGRWLGSCQTDAGQKLRRRNPAHGAWKGTGSQQRAQHIRTGPASSALLGCLEGRFEHLAGLPAKSFGPRSIAPLFGLAGLLKTLGSADQQFVSSPASWCAPVRSWLGHRMFSAGTLTKDAVEAIEALPSNTAASSLTSMESRASRRTTSSEGTWAWFHLPCRKLSLPCMTGSQLALPDWSVPYFRC